MAGRWHAETADDTLAAMRSRPGGLTGAEAAERLATQGPNRLPLVPPVSALAVLAAQLRSVIVLLLAVAIVISLVFDDRIEAAAIAAVLVINTLIGFMTELRARRAMDALLRSTCRAPSRGATGAFR